MEAHVPRWRSAVDPQGLLLAKETVALPRRALHQHSGEGNAGHGFGDRSRGPRACRAGARHVQRRVPAMAEQRRHLARPRIGLQKPREDPRAVVELRSKRSSDGHRRIAEARIGGGRRAMGCRSGSGLAVPVAVAHAARDGLDRAQAGGKRPERGRVSPNRQRGCRVPRAVSNACSPSSPTKPQTASCPSTAEWTRAFARCFPIRPIRTASGTPRSGRRLSSVPGTGSRAPQRASSPTRSTALKRPNSSGDWRSECRIFCRASQTIKLSWRSGRPTAGAAWHCTGRSTSTSSLSRTTWSCGSAASSIGRRC